MQLREGASCQGSLGLPAQGLPTHHVKEEDTVCGQSQQRGRGSTTGVQSTDKAPQGPDSKLAQPEGGLASVS